MKRIIPILTIMCGSVFTLSAQTQTDSIKVTINKLFTAMKNSDTALLKTCFADSAVLQTVYNTRAGKTIIKTEVVKDFVNQMAGIPKDSAIEKIEFGNINVDGNLANVWTPYQFFFNDKFSHCGVNNFVLVRIKNEWLIQYIIDTRRRTGC